MSAVLEPPTATVDKQLEQLDTVTIRFAGDSGDGMQLTGTQFTNTSAIMGNDISTLPDFPAEIRAPAGSIVRVSCRYDNSQSKQPVLDGKPQLPRYVVWGEGTTDEMCLGVLQTSVTR